MPRQDAHRDLAGRESGGVSAVRAPRRESYPAVFMRGGTSRALFFHRRDLPTGSPGDDTADWDRIFCAALGTPDPNGRQLDGMGGGISSLSKVAVIGPPSRADADVDYTFAQVAIGERVVGYRGNCGNISSAVGPFAVEEGLIPAPADGEAVVRIHNTNTGKIIESRFAVRDGLPVEAGGMELQGVGAGAPIRLTFRDPGGAATGRLLPTGRVVDQLEVEGLGRVEASLVDAANPVVFVGAASIGLRGDETPGELDAWSGRPLFEAIRVRAAVAMGLASEEEARRSLKNLPLVSLVAAPRGSVAAVATRMISSGQPHKATPLTGAMCLAIAARLPGSVVQRALRPGAAEEGDFVLEHASGTLAVAAVVERGAAGPVAREAVVYRTARRLMEGRVYLRP
ncbi:2-methylaconitate cis-trans isomerase PrpF family protein [Pararoseomonas indoligenes]|uniref:PrpF family protein n=1 Tax=Roseomonas indoligenes TaxID=2820811 RepID=A0A940N3G6_9PROT|nr:PrpF domain-containing protein [Pararoseomonas indoligenes]MBP0495894.1 PrpF family protein [Pararoseomonas indoligenes]